MTISNLTTTDNFEQWYELFNDVVDISNKIGSLPSLTTTDKTTLVNAINELVTKIGSLPSLTTTDKTTLVNAINELVGEIDDRTIGVDVQAFHAILQAISAIGTITTDKLIYSTGTNTFSTSTITSLMRNLLASATTADARTVLGLGAIAVLNTINNSNWSGTQLAIANGGTNATNETDARGNLGVSYGQISLFNQALG